jgi:hypothetical protein
MTNVPIDGLSALSKKLEGIEAATSAKLLRSAAMSATLPTFRKIQAAAPVGSTVHRTYKGRLVAPGFLKRSIRRKSWLKGGKATVMIGVRREAFYGIAFLDRGTDGGIVKAKRKISSGKTVRYSYYRQAIKGHNWFAKTFESDALDIVSLFKAKLRQRISSYNKRVKK